MYGLCRKLLITACTATLICISAVLTGNVDSRPNRTQQFKRNCDDIEYLYSQLSEQEKEEHYNRALLLTESGHYGQAALNLLHLLHANYKICDVQTQLSILYFYIGDDEMSEYYFNKALMSDPEF